MKKQKLNWTTGSDEDLEQIIVNTINMTYTAILLLVIMIALKFVLVRCI